MDERVKIDSIFKFVCLKERPVFYCTCATCPDLPSNVGLSLLTANPDHWKNLDLDPDGKTD